MREPLRMGIPPALTRSPSPVASSPSARRRGATSRRSRRPGRARSGTRTPRSPSGGALSCARPPCAAKVDTPGSAIVVVLVRGTEVVQVGRAREPLRPQPRLPDASPARRGGRCRARRAPAASGSRCRRRERSTGRARGARRRSAFGPRRRSNAVVPWPIPKRKSLRPCAMNTGVVTEPSLARLERSAAHGRAAAAFPVRTAACRAASDGSRLRPGIAAASPATRPD